jgi:hypothetical protein
MATMDSSNPSFRLLPVLIASAIASHFAATVAAAEVLRVPADHATIQGAIVAASPGDEIRVAPGTYVEVIDFLGKRLHIRSDSGPAVTRIEKPLAAGTGIPGGHPSSPVVFFRTGETRDSILEGFTVAKGTGVFSPLWACNCDGYQLGGGIFIAGASPTIRGCRFRDNSCFTYFSRGGGIFTEGGSPRIEHCQFIANHAGGAYGRGGAIWVGSGAPEIYDCDVRLNTNQCYWYGHGGGIWVEGGSPTLERVRIVENTSSHGIGGLQCTPTTRLKSVYLSGNTVPQVSGTYVDLGGNVTDGDCNANGVQDLVDLAQGTSSDLDANRVPDECDCLFSGTDSDGDGTRDCDDGCPSDPLKSDPGLCGCGAAGRDLDADGLEDCCLEGTPHCCLGDLDGNGQTEAEDLCAVLFAWGPATKATQALDLDGDGQVGATDLAVVIGGWGPCP